MPGTFKSLAYSSISHLVSNIFITRHCDPDWLGEAIFNLLFKNKITSPNFLIRLSLVMTTFNLDDKLYIYLNNIILLAFSNTLPLPDKETTLTL